MYFSGIFIYLSKLQRSQQKYKQALAVNRKHINMENKANANALISQNRAVGIYKNTTVITTGSYLG